MFESDLMIYYQYDIPKKVHWLWIPIYTYIPIITLFLFATSPEGGVDTRITLAADNSWR